MENVCYGWETLPGQVSQPCGHIVFVGDGVCEVCIIVYTRVLLFLAFLLLWYDGNQVSPPPPSLTWMNTLFAHLYTQGVCISFSMIYQYTLFRWAPGCLSHSREARARPSWAFSPGSFSSVDGPPFWNGEDLVCISSAAACCFEWACETTQSVWYPSQKIHFSASLGGSCTTRASRCWWCVVPRQLPRPRVNEGGQVEEAEVLFFVLAATLVITLFHPSLQS